MADWFRFFVDSLPAFWQGLLITLELTVVGLALGLGARIVGSIGPCIWQSMGTQNYRSGISRYFEVHRF